MVLFLEAIALGLVCCLAASYTYDERLSLCRLPTIVLISLGFALIVSNTQEGSQVALGFLLIGWGVVIGYRLSPKRAKA